VLDQFYAARPSEASRFATADRYFPASAGGRHCLKQLVILEQTGDAASSNPAPASKLPYDAFFPLNSRTLIFPTMAADWLLDGYKQMIYWK
jgi:hypothetical protein